jgi:hypothetical protein
MNGLGVEESSRSLGHGAKQTAGEALCLGELDPPS